MSGWIRVDRSLFEHSAFEDPWEWGVWAWLLANAAWRNTAISRQGRKIFLDAGQLSHSQRFLATKWSCDKNKVGRFLQKLVEWDMVTIGGGTKETVITICNYVDYQTVGEEHGTNLGHVTGQARDIERDKLGPQNGTKKNTLTIKQDNHTESTDVDSSVTDAPDAVQIAFDEYSSAVEAHNANLGGDGVKLPKPMRLTPKRRSALARALREIPDGNSFSDVIRAIGQSPCLLGRSDLSWRMDIDFICKKDKFMQILEGKYSDPTGKSPARSNKRYSGAELFDIAVGRKG